MEKIPEFFNLLILNDETKIKEFVISNGKAPKAVCPIRFIDKEEFKKRKEIN